MNSFVHIISSYKFDWLSRADYAYGVKICHYILVRFTMCMMWLIHISQTYIACALNSVTFCGSSNFCVINFRALSILNCLLVLDW